MTIDRVASAMTDGRPRDGFSPRVMARIDGRPAPGFTDRVMRRIDEPAARTSVPRALVIVPAAIALAAPTLFNTLFKLALFLGIGGLRRAAPGAASLALVSAALLVPIVLALA